jgi:uncharacterized protein (DUF697 family)
VCRVPAAEIETLVVGVIRAHAKSCPSATTDRTILDHYCERLVIKRESVELFLKHAANSQTPSISLPWAPQPLTRRREIILPSTKSDRPTRPIRAETRARLIEGIAKGRLWLNELVSETTASTQKIATRERCSERSVRMTLSLAFLSPALVKSAIEGTLPYGVGITQFIEPTLNWNDQIQVDMCRCLAECYGHDLKTEDVKHLTMLIAFAGTIEQAAGPTTVKVGSRAGVKMIQQYLKGSALQTLKQMLRTIGVNFTRKSMEKAIPFGVGAAVGSSINYGLTRYVGRSAKAFFLISSKEFEAAN